VIAADHRHHQPAGTYFYYCCSIIQTARQNQAVCDNNGNSVVLKVPANNEARELIYRDFFGHCIKTKDRHQ
jgi:hypothetical protein